MRHTASAASADFASGAAEDFRSADMVADSSSPIAPLSPAAAAAAVQSKGLTGLAARVVFGTALGVAGALVILTGGWCYMISACFVAYQASREYFGFLTSKGISEGMQPPPPLATTITTLCCIGLVFWTFISQGKSTAALTIAALLVLSLQLLTTKKPRFAQLTSSVFGLFYCGYLPSYWIKLRLLRAPAINSAIAQHYPVLLGGLSQWTVGLLATVMAVSCIVAADVGAYFFGKSWGRTKLTDISPKKTVEGAVGGLLCSTGVAVAFSKCLSWPVSPAAAAVLGVIIFFASLFGDLLESAMKREAGLKDASNLIPGHGGLLDRFDSYLFTGGVVYWFARFCLPSFGL